MFTYQCKVINWLDGDTLDAEVDLGFNIKFNQRIRVGGINCPEKNTLKGVNAKLFAISLLPVGEKFTAKTIKPNEKYGRWLASITLNSMKDFATCMIEAGHAVPYDGGPR